MRRKSYSALLEKKIYRYRRRRPLRMIRRYGMPMPYCNLSSLRFFVPYSINHFSKKMGICHLASNKIKIPRVFSFHKNFNETINVFKQFITFFVRKYGYAVADFSDCEFIGISEITLLQVLYEEFLVTQKRYQRINHQYELRNLKVIPSFKEQKVKKFLHAFGFYKYENLDGEVLPFDLIRGKYRRSYIDNNKADAIQKIVSFINQSFEPVHKQLSLDGLNVFQSLISEILNNAEDHSYRNCEWSVNAISFNEQQFGENVVEVNLSIINFGNSMYEGFEETKNLNNILYEKVRNKYDKHCLLFDSQHSFEREALFMLYMLNEGISRLKYEDSSRGNGTMQFLQAFATLGSFGKRNSNFKSILNVISGHTVLSCDNSVGPYTDGTHLKLSLNEEKDLSLLPDKRYLKTYEEFFPGTIIECKIYLNEHFFDEILNNGKQ